MDSKHISGKALYVNAELEHEWIGNHNDLPQNFKQISETDFWEDFENPWGFEFYCIKYICNVPRKHPFYGKHLRLFVKFDGTGFGYARHVEMATATKPQLFFRCGACEHDYIHSSPYMHEHVYKCSKCGHEFTVDSSG